MRETLGRREFLRRTALAAAFAAVPAGLTAFCEATGSTTASIPMRVLGRTNVELPILGYGGAALPKVWGNQLSTEERVELVRYAVDRGIRYFDTAGNYMESQPILGEGLKGIRGQVFLVTKVETTDPGKVRSAVERSLNELQTHYLDAILIHGSPGIQQMTVEQALRIHGELVKLRNEKMTRFIGLSAHGYFDKALALISSGGFDLCMLSHGYIPRGYDQIWSARMTELRNACVAKTHELGMGLIAMKVIGGGMLGAWSGYIVPGFEKGRLRQLPGAAIRYVLADDRFHLFVIGMRLKDEIDANIRTLADDLTYTADDRTLLKDFSAKLYETETIKKMRVE